MPKEQLQALADDVERLLSAGGAVAAGDEGLRRRAQTLRELGKKVPVLAQIAESVERVTGASAAQATRALLDLLLVVRQVRASLATAGVEGTLEPVAATGSWQTNTPAHDCYLLVETLRSSGNGRLETLADALNRGVIADLRLLGPLLDGLGDGYGQLANLIAEAALPAFGPGLVPELRRALNLKGNQQDARRLEVICRLDEQSGAELCHAALAEGNTTLKVQALKCLPRVAPSKAEQVALEVLAQKPARDLRCAALAALAGSRNDAALDALLAAVAEDQETWTAAREALGKLPHPQTTPRLVLALHEALKQLAEFQPEKPRKAAKAKANQAQAGGAEDKARTRAADGVCRLLDVLGARGERQTVPEILPLLPHPHVNVRNQAVEVLGKLDDPTGLEAAAALVDDPDVWRGAIAAAWKLPPAQLYQRLAPLCENLSDSKPTQRERGEGVLALFAGLCNVRLYGPPQPDGPAEDATRPWDPRWAKLLAKHLDGPNRGGVALALAVVQREKAVPQLLRLLPEAARRGENGVIQALGWLRARQAVEPLVELLAVKTQHHYVHYWICAALRHIGDPAAIPALQQVLDKVKDSYQTRMIEEVISYLETHAAS